LPQYCDLFVAPLLDVIVAWALYTVFTPVNRNRSLLAAWFRVVYAGMLMVAISHLVRALAVLEGPQSLAVSSPAQLNAQVLLELNTSEAIWSAGLVLFSFHLLLLGYLAYRQRTSQDIWGPSSSLPDSAI